MHAPLKTPVLTFDPAAAAAAATPSLLPGWPRTGVIEYDNVWMKYGPACPYALKGVTFRVEHSEKVGVVGRTGSGKSTLLLALYRMFELDKGTIKVDGIDVATLKLREVRPRGCLADTGVPACMLAWGGVGGWVWTLQQVSLPCALHLPVRFTSHHACSIRCCPTNCYPHTTCTDHLPALPCPSLPSSPQLRPKLSVIPQEPVVFSGTVRSNLDPFNQKQDVELWEVLKKVGLESQVKMTGGLDGKVDGTGGQAWSLGQQQLVCLARAALANVPILCLDEVRPAAEGGEGVLLVCMGPAALYLSSLCTCVLPCACIQPCVPQPFQLFMLHLPAHSTTSPCCCCTQVSLPSRHITDLVPLPLPCLPPSL
jgi:ABC-type cobalamin/Fe3+-siderophores transport system ATPase subunit